MAMPASNVEHSEGTFETADGLKLFSQHWQDESGGKRAVLVVVHGLKDHSSRYAEFASTMASRGFVVDAFDLRGHGRSPGKRSYVSRFEDLVSDLGGLPEASGHAAVLAMETPIVILDEPTSGQDDRGAALIGGIVDGLVRAGRTVLAVAHDIDFCAEHFQRTIVMGQGRLLLSTHPGRSQSVSLPVVRLDGYEGILVDL